MIGAGGIARLAYDGCEGENIVALCDIDSRHFPEWAAGEGTPTYSDFRVMLDKMGNEIDAVCINTPDHTHFAATIDSMQRGKHVCTQKPLTHNIWQARTLRKAKDKYGLVTNMANQGHTSDGIRIMREWYEADVFGQITEVHLRHQRAELGE
jgi:predicted dehydrogenase